MAVVESDRSHGEDRDDLHQEVHGQMDTGDPPLGAGVLRGLCLQDACADQQGDCGQVGDEGPRQRSQEVVRAQQRESPSH